MTVTNGVGYDRNELVNKVIKSTCQERSPKVYLKIINDLEFIKSLPRSEKSPEEELISSFNSTGLTNKIEYEKIFKIFKY